MTQGVALFHGSSLAERLFKVRPGEGRKVLLFALLGALLQAGVAVGISTADALFLTRVGVDRLPVIYLFIPVVLAVYVPVVTLSVARAGVERTLIGVLGALILGGVAFYLVLGGGEPSSWVYYAIKFYAALWYIGLYTLFWNFADRFFDIQDGKRLFALFSAGGAFGAVVGGALVGLLAHGTTLGVLFLLWAIFSAVAIPVALWICRRYPALDEEEVGEDTALSDKLKRTGHTLRRSPYVRIFALTLIGVLFVTSLVEFQYLTIFSEGADEAELALLFGLLFAGANLVNLGVNLFLFNRLVLTIGVGNVALIQPVVYLVAFALLMLEGGTLAAVFGFLAFHSILTSIDYNNQNLLFNAIPARVKREVRTIMEGMAEPLATALAGAFLLLFATQMAPQDLSTVGFTLAAGCFLLALGLRAQYGRSMVANLKEEWLDLAHPPPFVAEAVSEVEWEHLNEAVADPDPGVAVPALRILWQLSPSGAHRKTWAFFQQADDGGRKTALPLMERVLSEGGLDLVREILTWVVAHRDGLDPEFLALLGGHGIVQAGALRSPQCTPDPGAAAAALVPLWNSSMSDDRREASRVLNELLDGGEEQVLAGLMAVGAIGDEPLGMEAARFLDHPSPEVRRASLVALSRSVGPASAGLVPPIMQAVRDGREEDGLLGIECLRRIGDPTSVAPLLALTERFSPRMRRRVAGVIQEIGHTAVPSVIATMRSQAFTYGARGLAARVLASVAFPQLGAISPTLVEEELVRAEECDERRIRAGAFLREWEGGASSTVEAMELLRRYYEERRDRIVDFILEVLSLGGQLPDFELLSATLRSGAPKERGNAIETLEQGVPRAVFLRLLALLEGEASSGRPTSAEGAASGGSSSRELDAFLHRSLNSEIPLEGGLAAHILRERGGMEVRARFRERLTRPHGPFLRDVILLEPRGWDTSVLARIRLLAEAPFYRELPLAELYDLAHKATIEDGVLVLPQDRILDHLSSSSRFAVAWLRRQMDEEMTHAS